MKTITASVCSCGAMAFGPRHEFLMTLHFKSEFGYVIYNDEAMAMRSMRGKRYFPREVDTLPMFHFATTFRRGVSVEFLPIDDRTLATAQQWYSLIYPDHTEDFEQFAIEILAQVIPPLTSIERHPQYAICLHCEWKAQGRGASNLGSWHACHTRHRVVYSGNKFNKTINLIPVPVRRAVTYKDNFKMQQRMPCDIDPYKHPECQYGTTPEEVADDYKSHMRTHAQVDSIFPSAPWADPFYKAYESLINNGVV